MKILITLPFRLWLLALVIIPLCFLFLLSFVVHTGNGEITLTMSHYRELINVTFLKIVGRSLEFATLCAFLTALIGYPTAYALSTVNKKWRPICLMLLVIPFWTSSLVRAYAIKALLKTHGLLNHALLSLGIIHLPMQFLYTEVAVTIGMVYNLLPFMVLPLYSTFDKLDSRLVQAARDLGANRWRVFSQVVWPLTLSGVWVGLFFVFLPAMTLFYLPAILGGAKSVLLGNLITMQFLVFHEWGQGAATSVLLTALVLIMLLAYRFLTGRFPSERGL